MTEEQIKFISKYVVENSNRLITKEEKEIVKSAIDNSENMKQLIDVLYITLMTWQ